MITIITPPAVPVVSPEEAQAYLRNEAADNALVQRLVESVTDWVAGPHGWLGRSLVPWTLELGLPHFPSPVESIRLPRPPLIEIEAVTFTDAEGQPQTVDTAVYKTIRRTDGFAWIGLASGQSWPQGSDVRIRYRAGYEDGESPPGPAVPQGIKQAILAVVARQYEYREAGLPGQDDPFIFRLFSDRKSVV